MPVRPAKTKIPWMKDRPSGIRARSRDDFYHTNVWKTSSRIFREDNPLCIECRKTGRLVPATVTDHIIPKDICKDPWDQDNWQPLCKEHHAKKSATDKKYFK